MSDKLLEITAHKKCKTVFDAMKEGVKELYLIQVNKSSSKTKVVSSPVRT